MITSDLDIVHAREPGGLDRLAVFEDARVKDRNLLRFIDTTFFERDVSRIETTRSRGDVPLTLTAEPDATPNVTREGGHIDFDFAHETQDTSG